MLVAVGHRLPEELAPSCGVMAFLMAVLWRYGVMAFSGGLALWRYGVVSFEEELSLWCYGVMALYGLINRLFCSVESKKFLRPQAGG